MADHKGLIYERVLHDNSTYVKVLCISLEGEAMKTVVSNHWHRSMEIIYPLIGCAHIRIGEKHYAINVGDVFVVNPGEVHELYNTSDETRYLGYAIQIPFSFLNQNISGFGKMRFEHLIKDCASEFTNALDKLIEAYDSNDLYSNLSVKAALYEMSFLLLKNYSKQDEAGEIPSDKQREHLTKAVNFMDRESDNIDSMDEVASYCGLSYGYIANLFNEFLGISMTEYLNQIRLEKAEEDLIRTDKSITEIVSNRGFSNSKTFYRVFKQHHNESPKAYRRKYRT
ncbi:MAG: AraC family transcriptional regulator [Lachnospiraceae bacterium]|nr:AraC family transcriptional regulator [Lachnospiraceae bacterium]